MPGPAHPLGLAEAISPRLARAGAQTLIIPITLLVAGGGYTGATEGVRARRKIVRAELPSGTPPLFSVHALRWVNLRPALCVRLIGPPETGKAGTFTAPGRCACSMIFSAVLPPRALPVIIVDTTMRRNRSTLRVLAALSLVAAMVGINATLALVAGVICRSALNRCGPHGDVGGSARGA